MSFHSEQILLLLQIAQVVRGEWAHKNEQYVRDFSQAQQEKNAAAKAAQSEEAPAGTKKRTRTPRSSMKGDPTTDVDASSPDESNESLTQKLAGMLGLSQEQNEVEDRLADKEFQKIEAHKEKIDRMSKFLRRL